MNRKRLTALLLALALMLTLLTACVGETLPEGEKKDEPSGTEPNPTEINSDQQGNDTQQPETLAAHNAESYDDVALALREIHNTSNWIGGDMATEEAADAPAESPSADGMGGGSDSSETNVQVAGVDEADFVKNDGEYIYILSGYEVRILKADGAKTDEVGKILFGQEESENSYIYANGIYLYEDTLAIQVQYNEWGTYTDGEYYGRDKNAAELWLYNISDVSTPYLIDKFSQDGYYIDSRMSDGVLYLLSSYYVYDVESNDPGAYIPCIRDTSGEEMIAAHDIIICPMPSSTTYSVLTTIDMESGKRISQLAALDGAEGCYMTKENLYLYTSHYSTEESEPYTKNQYQVVDYYDRSTTSIMRFALSGGSATLAATGEVNGMLLNQFSLDEYEGNLRLALTRRDYGYSVYTDEELGFTNYMDLEGVAPQSNAVCILDASLQKIGELGDFGIDEQIYSARFLGALGYVVTFRQTDPLFAIDLSDPSNPKMLSELKVTGFSSYLHPYADGQLIGIGMEADAETGATSGLKLSMFDISEPDNVSELHTVHMDDWWSEVLYNHKAALISKDKNLIAFPGEDSYYVYGYDEENGFTLRTELPAVGYSNSRGLYIGDYFYICEASRIVVADLQSFEQVSDLSLAFG